MSNIRLSHLAHFKTIPYKQIDNFRDFYYEEKTNDTYFLDWDHILKYHKATGYDGIELLPWDLTEIVGLFGSPEAYVDFCQERGLVVSGMFHGCDDSHIAEKHDEVFEAGKQAIDTLKKLGGKCLNTCPASNYSEIGALTDEGLKNVATVITDIGRYAVDNGIKVCLHNEFFCAVNKYNHRQFLEMTDPRYVFYCLDTAQIKLMGDDVLDFYDTYADRIATFHLKDTASVGESDSVRFGQEPGLGKDVEITRDGHRWFWEPGEGTVDMEGLWKLLKKHHFQGWVSIEDDQTPDLLAAMALASYHVHEVLGKIYK